MIKSDTGKTIEEICAIIVANCRQKKVDWWAVKMEVCELLDTVTEQYDKTKEAKP